MSYVCRTSFPKIRGVVDRLVQTLMSLGPVTPVDMDLMCAKLSWDIIGESVSCCLCSSAHVWWHGNMLQQHHKATTLLCLLSERASTEQEQK